MWATNLQQRPLKVHHFRKIGTCCHGIRRIQVKRGKHGGWWCSGTGRESSFGHILASTRSPSDTMVCQPESSRCWNTLHNTLRSSFCKTLRNISELLPAAACHRAAVDLPSHYCRQGIWTAGDGGALKVTSTTFFPSSGGHRWSVATNQRSPPPPPTG